MDDWNSDPHAQSVARDQDLHGHWLFIPDNEIYHFADAFTYLEADGTLYYLPAFMSYCLKHERRCDHVVACVLFHLSDHDALSSTGKFPMLNEEQRAAVAAFLEWCTTYCDREFDRTAARMALRAYWQQFKDWSL